MELVGMLSISCEGIAEGLRSPLGPGDVKAAFRSAEHAMAAALRIHRRLRDLRAAAPELETCAEHASVSRSASQVRLDTARKTAAAKLDPMLSCSRRQRRNTYQNIHRARQHSACCKRVQQP